METPTAHNEKNLREMALQLRISASQTADDNYIALFLCAAISLEARAATMILRLSYRSR